MTARCSTSATPRRRARASRTTSAACATSSPRARVTYQGRPQRVRWAKTAVRPRVPISICAEGPRMLHLGGRIGDGVICGTGLLPEVIKDTIARIHAGAREAGRDPAEVDIWFTTRTSLDTDRDRAIEDVKPSVSSILNHSMRFGLDGKHVPADLRAKVQDYVDGYELYDHVLHGGRTRAAWRTSVSPTTRSSASPWPAIPRTGSRGSRTRRGRRHQAVGQPALRRHGRSAPVDAPARAGGHVALRRVAAGRLDPRDRSALRARRPVRGRPPASPPSASPTTGATSPSACSR